MRTRLEEEREKMVSRVATLFKDKTIPEIREAYLELRDNGKWDEYDHIMFNIHTEELNLIYDKMMRAIYQEEVRKELEKDPEKVDSILGDLIDKNTSQVS